MRAAFAFVLLFAGGCGTAPVARLLDWLAPAGSRAPGSGGGAIPALPATDPLTGPVGPPPIQPTIPGLGPRAEPFGPAPAPTPPAPVSPAPGGQPPPPDPIPGAVSRRSDFTKPAGQSGLPRSAPPSQAP